MSSSTKMVNAWILLSEDEPAGTNYNTVASTNPPVAASCYQDLITNDVYQAVDMLFLCFVEPVRLGTTTVPTAAQSEAGTYTLQIQAATHPDNLTNQDYMNYVIRDARKNNPNIKILVTLDWGDLGNQITEVFSNSAFTAEESAAFFAANLVAYLEYYQLDGFDIDWEPEVCFNTTSEQFTLLITAIGDVFKQQSKKYYLTISPSQVGNLVAGPVNSYVDFVNLQLYGGATPGEFSGVNSDLFAYGAKWEAMSAGEEQGYQTAQKAYDDNNEHYNYSIFTAWRLNSSNYQFEQEQQKALYKLVKG